MAFTLNHYHNIVNVKWAGGVFVNGDFLGLGRYLKSITQETWTSLGTMAFTAAGSIWGSSFATVMGATGKLGQPRFLLVGTNNGGETGLAPREGIIMASDDGHSNWSKVFTLSSGGDPKLSGATMLGVVWDKNESQFYAGGQIFQRGGPEDVIYDVLLRSSDGKAWNEVGRVSIVSAPESVEGLLAKHCNKRILDKNGHAVPDGVYVFDEQNNTTMAPVKTPTIMYRGGYVDVSDAGNSIRIKSTTTSEIVNAGIKVTCVAGAGGVLMAAGFTGSATTDPIAATAYSTAGETETWKMIDPGGLTNGMIHTMCCGRGA